ncbi:carbohydrate ABC transporter permease [Streptomyces sp. NPDC059104]|uniref:carbohydrate ABC transporter permease n=1 Tax=Streptomyces sp. NPDC059104 TaxID=3346729 RepID=UPI003673BF21
MTTTSTPARQGRRPAPPTRAPRAPRRFDRPATAAFVLLVAPTVLGLALFKYLAIGWSFLLSLSEARGTISLGRWTGLDNYRTLLQAPGFRGSLWMIIGFSAVIVPLTFAASLGLAMLVNRLRRGKGFLRTAFLMPAAVSYVAASLLWKMALFNGLPSGIANSLGHLFGAEPVPWLSQGDPPLYWVALITLRLWLQVGLYMILFLAGLQNIPPFLHEAAQLDGASGRQVFRHITWPQLRNTSVAVLLLMSIGAMQAFDEFYNLFSTGMGQTGTAPVRPPLVYLYGVALGDQDYGVGSAGAFLLTALILAVTLLQGRIFGYGDKD